MRKWCNPTKVIAKYTVTPAFKVYTSLLGKLLLLTKLELFVCFWVVYPIKPDILCFLNTVVSGTNTFSNRL